MIHNNACNYWTDGNYCGDANTRRYMNGQRCIKHIPATIRRGALFHKCSPTVPRGKGCSPVPLTWGNGERGNT
jgi:hypothetical protein